MPAAHAMHLAVSRSQQLRAVVVAGLVVGLVEGLVTVMTPFMDGWMLQKYGKVPG
jgi:hypothetical protein